MTLDPLTAAFDRSAKRFAEKVGVEHTLDVQDGLTVEQFVNQTIDDNPEFVTATLVDKVSREFPHLPRTEIEAMTKAAQAAKAPTPKTAASEMGGSQNQTMKDAGDYGAASKVFSDNAAQVHANAPDGTPEQGNQLQSVEYKDKSYPQAGGGDAKLAMKAIMALIDVDPKAAAKLVHIAAEGDMTPPMGGKPDAVASGEAEADGAAAPGAMDAAPAPATAPAGPSGDQQAAVKLQQVVKDKTDQLSVDKAVNDQLQDVLKEIQSIKDPTKRAIALAQVKKALDTSARDKVTETVAQGNNVVPHSSTDPKDVPQTDGDPDWTLYDLSKEVNTDKTQGHTGQEYAASGDRSYAIASLKKEFDKNKEKLAKNQAELKAQAQNLMKTGMSTKAAVEFLSKTALGQKTKELAVTLKKMAEEMSAKEERKAEKEEDKADKAEEKAEKAEEKKEEAKEKEEKAEEKKEDKKEEKKEGSLTPVTKEVFAAKRAKLGQRQAELRNQYKALVASGMKPGAAVEFLKTTKLAKKTEKLVATLKTMAAQLKTAADDASGRDVGGNVPPDETKTPQADDTSRYEGESKGDTSADLIAKGTDTRFESPETGATVNDGRSMLDSKHNSDVKGSTTASLNSREANVLASTRKEAARLSLLITGAIDKAAKVGTKAVGATLVASLTELANDYKTLTAKFDQANTDKDRATLRAVLSALVAVNKSAKREMRNIQAMANDIHAARTRMAQVTPAFKLAINQVRAGLMELSELPEAVASYAKMESKELEVVTATVSKLINKAAERKPTGQSKTASMLPSVHTDPLARTSGPADELEGLFDE